MKTGLSGGEAMKTGLAEGYLQPLDGGKNSLRAAAQAVFVRTGG
jgi:hypothetical protein